MSVSLCSIYALPVRPGAQFWQAYIRPTRPAPVCKGAGADSLIKSHQSPLSHHQPPRSPDRNGASVAALRGVPSSDVVGAFSAGCSRSRARLTYSVEWTRRISRRRAAVVRQRAFCSDETRLSVLRWPVCPGGRRLLAGSGYKMARFDEGERVGSGRSWSVYSPRRDIEFTARGNIMN